MKIGIEYLLGNLRIDCRNANGTGLQSCLSEEVYSIITVIIISIRHAPGEGNKNHESGNEGYIMQLTRDICCLSEGINAVIRSIISFSWFSMLNCKSEDNLVFKFDPIPASI